MSILNKLTSDRALIRHLSIGFAIGAAGMFAATGLPLATEALAAVFA